MYEIASAEEQITLFKLITDKVWQSLADQKRQADGQAAQQRRAQAMNGGRAKRAPTPKPIKPLKPIKPVPVAPPPKPQPIQPTQQQTQAPNNPTPNNAMAQQSLGLADQRVAHYPQQRQQSAILPIRLR